MTSAIRSYFKIPWVYIGLIIIFIVNYIFQDLGISTKFTRNYLDDLLAMPIILFMSRMILRLVYQNRNLKLDLVLIVLGFLFISMAFEWLIPIYNTNFTGDFWDVLCYFFGTVFFYFYQKKEVGIQQ